MSDILKPEMGGAGEQTAGGTKEGSDSVFQECFNGYRAAHDLREPDFERLGGPAELQEVVLSPPEGFSMDIAPAPEALTSDPTRDGLTDETKKYLWIIRQIAVPVGLENGPTGRGIADRQRLSHTNLTGGSAAYCGGELWFRDQSSIALNGGSGRYPPNSLDELDAAVHALRCAGYSVACCGWDDERDGPSRFWRVDESWLGPIDG